MSELRDILADTVERLLTEHLSRDVRERVEAGEWPERLWQALDDNGLPHALGTGDGADAGVTFADAFVVAYQLGRAGAPVPLAETTVAAWLLARAGLAVPPGPLGLIAGGALEIRNGLLGGVAEQVPWGRAAGHAVSVVGDGAGAEVVLVECDAAGVSPRQNLAGEPRDTLRFEGRAVTAAPLPAGVPADAVTLLGAAARGAQMAGAAAWVLDTTLEYANDRVQFGRPLGKLQAIQHYLATLASRVAQGTIAAESAWCRCDESLEAAVTDIAAAKIVVGEAAGAACSIGHQVHGAIGFTREYELHYRTRRLLAWRAEYGSEAHWAERMGAEVVERGAEALWPDITAAGEAG